MLEHGQPPGDLKDPQKSIPPGTLLAVLCTTLVFSGQVSIDLPTSERIHRLSFQLSCSLA